MHEKSNATRESWKIAGDRVNMLVKQYKAMGTTGAFGLREASKLKERYDTGERTDRLMEDIWKAT